LLHFAAFQARFSRVRQTGSTIRFNRAAAQLQSFDQDRLHFRGSAPPNHGSKSPVVAAHLATFPQYGPPPFNAAFHAERRKTFLSRMAPNTTVIIPGASLKLRNGDVDFPFRQESNFHYLTGFDEPNSVAILSNALGQPEFVLIVPPLDPFEETWTGKRAGIKGAQSKYQANAAYSNTQAEEVFEEVARSGARIQVLDAIANPGLNKHIQDILKEHRALGRERREPEAEEQIHEMRLIKTPYEQALLKRACDISAQAHIRAMQKGKLTAAMMAKSPHRAQGRNEGELQAELEYDFRRHGAVRVGYGSIVGSGSNGCVLHYVTNTEFSRPQDLILVDAGAEYGYYTADVTRTWPLGGKFSPEQKAIYDLVLKAQEEGIRMSRPGATLRDIHVNTARVLTEGLVQLGILKGNPHRLLQEKAYDQYFMHGTSHMLGMDVHDVPTRSVTTAGSPLRGGPVVYRPLEPGMVFTVEPGIYIDPEVGRRNGVDPKWWGIGVRIEDDILITDTGHENLSQNVPRSTQEIEALMAG
jgi:Xaa-Pro aminopeptidase